ncbi:MAG: HAL/PAL/TAL family ammonia-lyase [Bacillota bacterium]
MLAADKVSKVILTGETLTIEEVYAIAVSKVDVEISEAAMQKVSESREVVEEIAKSDKLYYAVNTGTGSNKNVRISKEDLEDFQKRIILSHCIALEPNFPEHIVRAIMAVRINGMLKGAAGVQPQIVNLLKEMLNRKIHPIVPTRGTVGSSDIGPLSHLTLPLIGLGEVYYQGRKVSSKEAFDKENLKTINLGAKDGIGIINSNAASIGYAALLLWDCRELINLVDVSYALNLEGFRGNVSPLYPDSYELRPHPGQIESASIIRNVLEGSFLWNPDTARSVQDPISYRSSTQVHGTCREALEFVENAIRIEMNSMGDNPMISIEKRDMLSHGQFQITKIAVSFDFLKIALANLSTTLCTRILRLVDPTFSDLTAFLSPNPGICCGYSTFQKTISHLHSEIRHLANPTSMDYLPLNRDVEDISTMAPLTISNTEKLIKNLRILIGVEFMLATQAVDLLEKPTLGKGTKIAYDLVRSVVPFLDEDRIISTDVDKVHELLLSGKFITELNKYF